MAKVLTVARQLASLGAAEQKLAVSFARDLSNKGKAQSRKPRAPRKPRKPAAAPKPKPRVRPVPVTDDDE